MRRDYHGPRKRLFLVGRLVRRRRVTLARQRLELQAALLLEALAGMLERPGFELRALASVAENKPDHCQHDGYDNDSPDEGIGPRVVVVAPGVRPDSADNQQW